jgi:HAD superfamily hydrolase (TIGR01509 family)
MSNLADAIRQAATRYRQVNKAPAIRAALIDMDGTLYDSMVNHTAAWHRMVSDLGIDSNRDEYYLFEGMTGAATINLLFRRAFGRDATDEEVKNLYHLKTVYFNELPPVAQMPGAAKMLNVLSANNIQRVLVTGSGQASLIDRLNRDFPGAFRQGMMVTSHDVAIGKPHPEPYLKAMEIAGAKPAECIVVENAPLGVEAGARSGAFTIAVTTGPIPAEKMWHAGANIVFDSMQQLADNIALLLSELLTKD